MEFGLGLFTGMFIMWIVAKKIQTEIMKEIDELKNFEKMKSVKPINKYMLVSKVVEEMKSQSGLLYTSQESSDMRYQKAEVIAVGNLVDAINVGDNILYDKVYGHETIIEGVTYTVITEMNVVVVL